MSIHSSDSSINILQPSYVMYALRFFTRHALRSIGLTDSRATLRRYILSFQTLTFSVLYFTSDLNYTNLCNKFETYVAYFYLTNLYFIFYRESQSDTLPVPILYIFDHFIELNLIDNKYCHRETKYECLKCYRKFKTKHCLTKHLRFHKPNALYL